MSGTVFKWFKNSLYEEEKTYNYYKVFSSIEKYYKDSK
jgi:hypothetical protein